jgi:hypothetical protein
LGRTAGSWPLLLVVFLFLFLRDAKKLLAAELLEGQLQDLLQDLLIAVSFTKGVGLGLGVRRREQQGREAHGEEERAEIFASKESRG